MPDLKNPESLRTENSPEISPKLEAVGKIAEIGGIWNITPAHYCTSTKGREAARTALRHGVGLDSGFICVVERD